MFESLLESLMEPIVTREDLEDLNEGDWIWDSELVVRRIHGRDIYQEHIKEPRGFRLIHILDRDTLVNKPFMLTTLDHYHSEHKWEYFTPNRFWKFKDIKEKEEKKMGVYCGKIDCIHNDHCMCQMKDVAMDDDGKCSTMKVKSAADVWKEICDIPVRSNMTIMCNWRSFEEGTYLYDIWEWFDNEYGVMIRELVLNALRRKEQVEKGEIV